MPPPTPVVFSSGSGAAVRGTPEGPCSVEADGGILNRNYHHMIPYTSFTIRYYNIPFTSLLKIKIKNEQAYNFENELYSVESAYHLSSVNGYTGLYDTESQIDPERQLQHYH